MNRITRFFFLLTLLTGSAENFQNKLFAQITRATAQREVRLLGSAGSSIRLLPPAGTGTYSLLFPTTAPLANQVLAVSSINAGIANLGWSTAVGGIGSGSAGQVVHWSGANSQAGSNDFFWDATNKRLGIGTATPSDKFQVVEPSNTSLQTSLIARGGNNLKSQLSFGVRNGAGNAVGGTITSDGTFGGGIILQGNLNDQPSVSPHVFVNTSGELLVNTTTDIGAYKLQVNGDIYAPTARFHFVNSGGYFASLSIRSDGTLTTATSDQRLKRDIETISNPLEKIMALRGVTYFWKDSTSSKRMLGMVAQEVQQVVPELVYQNKTDGYYGINYGETAGLLIEAIKAQQHIILQLKEELHQQYKVVQASIQETGQLKKEISDLIKKNSLQ